MPKKNGNLALVGFGDIFNVGTPHDGECVVEIPLTELHARPTVTRSELTTTSE